MFKTSTCPVLAGQGGYEMWPHRIGQLALTDFRLIAGDSQEMLCD